MHIGNFTHTTEELQNFEQVCSFIFLQRKAGSQFKKYLIWQVNFEKYLRCNWGLNPLFSAWEASGFFPFDRFVNVFFFTFCLLILNCEFLAFYFQKYHHDGFLRFYDP